MRRDGKKEVRSINSDFTGSTHCKDKHACRALGASVTHAAIQLHKEYSDA